MTGLTGRAGTMRAGVLLTHGYAGNRSSMQPWADHLAGAGHEVVVPLLPGHGTTWQDMATTGWSDWYGCVEAAFEDLRARHDFVFLAGLSMGGCLSLRLAADRPSEVAGLIVVNPPVVIEVPRHVRWAAPVLKHVVASTTAVPEDIKKVGVVEGGYERLSTKAAHAVMKGIAPLAGDLSRITTPLLYFRSPEDHIVSDRSHELVLDRVSSDDVTLHLLADSYHVATIDNDAPFIYEESAAFISRIAAPAR